MCLIAAVILFTATVSFSSQSLLRSWQFNQKLCSTIGLMSRVCFLVRLNALPGVVISSIAFLFYLQCLRLSQLPLRCLLLSNHHHHSQSQKKVGVFVQLVTVVAELLDVVLAGFLQPRALLLRLLQKMMRLCLALTCCRQTFWLTCSSLHLHLQQLLCVRFTVMLLVSLMRCSPCAASMLSRCSRTLPVFRVHVTMSCMFVCSGARPRDSQGPIDASPICAAAITNRRASFAFPYHRHHRQRPCSASHARTC